MSTLTEDFTAIYSLKKYLAENMEGVSVFHGWPEPDKEMVMPTISVNLMGNIELYNHEPRFKEQIEIEGDDINVNARYAVARVEGRITLDLWERSKSHVSQLYKEIDQIFNAQSYSNIDNIGGLELELYKYFGEVARYTLLRYNYIEGEAEAQRRENRIQIVLEFHFDKIREVVMPRIIESDIQHDIQ